MFIKTIKVFPLVLFFSLTPTTFADNDTIPGVKDMVYDFNGGYSVTCANDSKAKISEEENNRCVFSKDNDKNRCDLKDNWTLKEAAAYACQ